MCPSAALSSGRGSPVVVERDGGPPFLKPPEGRDAWHLVAPGTPSEAEASKTAAAFHQLSHLVLPHCRGMLWRKVAAEEALEKRLERKRLGDFFHDPPTMSLFHASRLSELDFAAHALPP